MRFVVAASAALLPLVGCTQVVPQEDASADGLQLLADPSLAGWQHRNGSPPSWVMRRDGALEVVPGTGDLLTKQEFGDHVLELEFRVPFEADKTGQARGNSGVYIHGRYEIQILDSFAVVPAIDNCGAIYGVAPALASAARPPDTWQTYRVQFLAPKLAADGSVVEPARMTVLHNGVLIHNDVAVPAPTRAGLDDTVVARGPLLLQDHGSRVQFRDIRVWE